jgi:hypothetical protein
MQDKMQGYTKQFILCAGGVHIAVDFKIVLYKGQFRESPLPPTRNCVP